MGRKLTIQQILFRLITIPSGTKDGVALLARESRVETVVGIRRVGWRVVLLVGAVERCGAGVGGGCPAGKPAHAASSRPQATVCSREPPLATYPNHAALTCPMVRTH